MKRLLGFLFLIISLSNFAYAELDSPKPIYPKNQSREEYVPSKIDTDILHFDKLEAQKSDSLEAYGLMIFKECERLLEKNKSDNTKSKLALIANKLGDFYRMGIKPKGAIKYYQKCLALKKQLGEKGRPYVYVKLANTCNTHGEYALSMESSLKALELSNQIKNKTRNELVVVLFAQNIIGHTYSVIEEWDISLKYYRDGVKTAQECASYHGESLNLSNIGSIYGEIGDHSKSLYYYKRAFRLLELEREKIKKQQSGNLARLCCNISAQFIRLNELDSAKVYGNKALEAAKILNENATMLSVRFIESEIAFEQKNYKQAKEIAIDALSLTDGQTPADKLNLYKMLVKIYEKEGNDEQLSKYSKLSQIAKDSVLNLDKQKEIVMMNTKIELKNLDKKNNLVLLQKQKEINSIKNREIKIYVGAGLSFLALLVFSILWYRKHKKQILSKQLKAENEIKLHLDKIISLQSKVNAQLLENPSLNGESINKNMEEILHAKLTNRELDVLVELSKGKDNKKIATDLFISVNTVRTHLLKIYDKMDVKNRTQAVQKAENLSRQSV